VIPRTRAANMPLAGTSAVTEEPMTFQLENIALVYKKRRRTLTSGNIDLGLGSFFLRVRLLGNLQFRILRLRGLSVQSDMISGTACEITWRRALTTLGGTRRRILRGQ
jgi:hypothetical protein